VRIWQQEVMSIAFHQTAKISAGIIFQFGIFIRLRALSPFVGSGSKASLWLRADDFRSSPMNRHNQTGPTGPFRARSGLMLRSKASLPVRSHRSVGVCRPPDPSPLSMSRAGAFYSVM